MLAAHEDEFHIGDPGRHTPSAVVRPDGVDEVRAIVRLASELRIPLWTVSTGRNLGYGASAPRVRGCVVLELSRMNRILEVNEKLGYVLVEPGVRFFDLYEHLQREGIALWASVPGLGWGSVTGNALERGLGSTPYGDHSGNICGMEVVLADGDLLRTGMGALRDPSPGSSTRAATARHPRACSCSRTSASSRRSGCGSCRGRSASGCAT